MVIVNDGCVEFVITMNVYDIETEHVDENGDVLNPFEFFFQVMQEWEQGIGELTDVTIGHGYQINKVSCEKLEG